MTWTETHRRWQAMAEIEALVNASSTLELPWNDDYAAIFGDRDSLVAALRYRWNLARDAQMDLNVPEHVLEEQSRRIDARHANVLRVLDHYDRYGAPAPVPPHDERVPA